MAGESTYAMSYLKNDTFTKAMSMKPKTDLFFDKSPFSTKTIYKQSYLPSAVKKPELIIPRQALKMPDQRMACDTNYNVPCHNIILNEIKQFNKNFIMYLQMSYQPVGMQKRCPIIPARRSLMGAGKMDGLSTTQEDYVPKEVYRVQQVLPCSSIRLPKISMEGKTTTQLSFMKPPAPCKVKGYKPENCVQP